MVQLSKIYFEVGAMEKNIKGQLQNDAAYLTEEEYEIFLQAIDFAEHAHQDQKRATGEPYIIHPFIVCKILLDYKADVTTLNSSLLHDVAEDTLFSILDIEKRFGLDVSTIVDGLTKFEKGLVKEEEYDAINFEKLLAASANDIRVVIVKIADRLHNMRTLAVKKVEKQVPYANESLVFFSPLAERLGLYMMQKELEELSFQYVNPAKYKGVKKLLNNYSNLFTEVFESFSEKIKTTAEPDLQLQLDWYDTPIYKAYSLLQEGASLSDLYIIEVITDSTPNCYPILGILHGLFEPLDNQFHDNIAINKSFFHKHLTTKVFIKDIEVRIEIKTKSIKQQNQTGIFGLLNCELSKDETQKMSTKLLKDSISNVKSVSNNPIEFFDLISYELLQKEIIVFTPKMDVVALPEGSTALDFAFHLNPQLAKKMSSVKVNGKQKPLSIILKDKDIVGIDIENRLMVKKEWLNHAHTSKTRKEIVGLLNGSF
ncbi:HD domain-containing protein [Bacillus sp. JJ1609]|uniref:HD domain-containing protein n=1 Tax=Bacillus sp. JJ1609 TaxID=3122977 RepID=UPI002FFEC596